MGVYIKGMKMPESCPCVLAGDGYDTYCSFASGIPSRMREYRECCEKETRPNWCPIGDVPTPHGRLIDADELQRQFERMANEEWNKNIAVSAASCFDDAAVIVEDAPTIIEAEE